MMTPKWNATLYDDKHSFVWEKAQGVVEMLAPKAGERILDLGCGTGHLAAQIASSGAEVIGIDRSTEMIAQARKQYPELEFEVCDARAVPYENQFDAVFSNAALHWILELEKVVIGVARALRPGGRFVAEFGGKGNIRQVVEALARACEKFGVPLGREEDIWYYPSLAEYAGLLEKHGLEVREAALFDRPTRLEDGQKGLEVWLRMFVKFIVDRVPSERQEEFLREVE